eukprot:3918440-Prymnesium_polylepis.1
MPPCTRARPHPPPLPPLGAVQASTNHPGLSLTGGRWVTAPFGGIMTDTVGALASVRVRGTENVTFAVHGTCGLTLDK